MSGSDFLVSNFARTRTFIHLIFVCRDSNMENIKRNEKIETTITRGENQVFFRENREDSYEKPARTTTGD